MRLTRRRRSTSSWVSPGPRCVPDAAGLLGRAAPPRAAQPRKPVLEQGQLHLGAALGGAGVLGEDVEDHRGPVDGRAPEDLLQVALLGRGERVLEDHGVGVDGEAQLAQLCDLARAEERRGVGRVAALDDPRGDVGARGVDSSASSSSWFSRSSARDARELDADEDDPLADRAIDQGGGQIEVTARPTSRRPRTRTGPASVARSPHQADLEVPAGVGDGHRVADEPGGVRDRRRGARPGAARERPADPALDHGHRQRARGWRRVTNSTLAPPIADESAAARASRLGAVHVGSSAHDRVGVAHDRRAHRARPAPRPRVTVPMSTSPVPASPSRKSRTTVGPAAVATSSRSTPRPSRARPPRPGSARRCPTSRPSSRRRCRGSSRRPR